MRRLQREKAQALVEFALAATLIFFLLSATVDVGLMYLNMQALRVAAQDGATFGSYPSVVLNGNGTVAGVTLNFDEIRNRVRQSGGTRPVGLSNLLDLDNDSTIDVSPVGNQVGQSGSTYDTVPSGERWDTGTGTRLPNDPNTNSTNRSRTVNQYILVQAVYDPDGPSGPQNIPNGFVTDNNYLCTADRLRYLGGDGCFVRVTVRYKYKLFFLLAPAFGDTITLRSEFSMPIRSTFRG